MKLFMLIMSLGPEMVRLVTDVVKAIKSGDRALAARRAEEAARRQALRLRAQQMVEDLEDDEDD